MLTILQGDALEKLRELPDESAQCCVTSPPYWGLRDYGTVTWVGGEIGCDHRDPSKVLGNTRRNLAQAANRTDGGNRTAENRRDHDGTQFAQFPTSCGKCGAKRVDSQLGLEKTPEEYVAKLVAVFREVRRVLRSDGTLWLNLGDSYAGGGNNSGNTQEISEKQGSNRGNRYEKKPVPAGLKPKDLVGIPWMVAFALRADGWWLRQDIIWAKPNPMPESVTDRCTKAHEYLFLLSKSGRYYFDNEAIKESSSASYRNDGRWETGPTEENKKEGYEEAGARNPKRVHAVFNGAIKEKVNKRSVWSVTTAPYPEAHFATYPPELIKPCILAGTKAGDTVLDPFAGSGTTGQVALELARKALLIELNPKYIALIESRCGSVTLGLPF